MRAAQFHWSPATGWSTSPAADRDAQWLLVFGNPDALRDASWRHAVLGAFPSAVVTGCSTAGEIAGTQVVDAGLTCTAVHFDRTHLYAHATEVHDAADSYAAGQVLGEHLRADDLVHVIVFSDGLRVNGSDLVRGLTSVLGPGVGVTGGLSADGDRFRETLVLLGERCEPGLVVAVGLGGPALRVGCGSLGGWDPFGPERLITRSVGNVLHELDGRSALTLYETYLGDHAADLPASALRFPLSVRASQKERPVVRTVLAVDSSAGTMTFAGDVPQGAYAQLMRANVDRLVDGAAGAARTSGIPLAGSAPPLVLLISCVGRRLVLQQRVEEEVEAVRDVFGPGAVLAGFYSYGEISPFTPTARCELHNQTMTVTTFHED
ncbi:MAG: FIST C-terminal domain-containing protein [Gemmatimonadetes bacterium]|nr:FIST C-terminal domain-containing protein [Gemmatimonadota bacterium]